MRTRHLISGIAALIIVLTLMVFVTPGPSNAQDFGSNWLGEYFNNPNLTGSPAFTNVDAAVNFTWGTNSPNAAFLPADGFSVRWSGFQTIAVGVYRFTMTHDDSLRVTVDGTVIFDQLTRTGGIQTQVVEVAISGGDQHLVVVEYVDRSGEAVVQVQWALSGSLGPTATEGPSPTPTATGLPPIPPGSITATVIRAGVLNVRSAPSLGAPRVGVILRGQTYAVVGRNEKANWFLLQLAGRQAWAYGYYLFIDGNEFTPPITNSTSVFGLPAGVPNTGVLAQARAVIKLRAAPTTNSTQTGRITWGGFVPIVGRTSDGVWYQVVWKDTLGWAYSPFLRIIEGDLINVPIVNP